MRQQSEKSTRLKLMLEVEGVVIEILALSQIFYRTYVPTDIVNILTRREAQNRQWHHTASQRQGTPSTSG